MKDILFIGGPTSVQGVDRIDDDLISILAVKGLYEREAVVLWPTKDFMTEPKNPDELTDWYAAADIFCLVSSREGCPNVVLESLSCGTPVVATAVGGIPDIISNEDIGILVERTPESICQGIVEALERTWEHSKIVQYAQERFSWETTAEKVYNVFEKLV